MGCGLKQVILAVDGGATKTTMTLRTEDGRELFSTTSTGSNYQAIGGERVQHLFEVLLLDAKRTVSEGEITVAVFAIAGIDTNEDAKVMQQLIEASIQHAGFTVRNLIIENDVEATLLGLADRRPASLLISGTGAICFSYNGNEIVRTGGWGHRAGDEGSGYWIGRQIAKAIFQAEDGRAAPTILTDFILEANHLADVPAFMNWLYRADYTNARLASLSSHLQPAAERGDRAAREIAGKAAEELALLATAALRKAECGGNTHPFYVNGGILKNIPAIYDLVTSKVKETFPAVQFKLCDEKPIEYIVKRAESLARLVK